MDQGQENTVRVSDKLSETCMTVNETSQMLITHHTVVYDTWFCLLTESSLNHTHI